MIAKTKTIILVIGFPIFQYFYCNCFLGHLFLYCNNLRMQIFPKLRREFDILSLCLLQMKLETVFPSSCQEKKKKSCALFIL